MTIREYATTRNVTYENVRQLVKKFADDLEGHITKNGRTRILDNDAVKLLDDRRKGTGVKVIKSTSNTNAELIDQLKNEIILLQRQLLDAKEDSRKTALEHAQSVARLDAVSDANKRMQEEIDTLRTENSRYHKTLFGLYRKDKN